MARKRSESSPREKRLGANSLFMKPVSASERRQLAALARMPDSKIDYSDIPPVASLPNEVHIGRFYRPIKEQISLRVDADVLAWFRSRGKKYQTYMNQVLRREMQAGHKRRRAS